MEYLVSIIIVTNNPEALREYLDPYAPLKFHVKSLNKMGPSTAAMQLARKMHITAYCKVILEGKKQNLTQVANHMVKLGLYSSRTASKDIRWSIMKYVAKLQGFRYVQDFLKQIKSSGEEWGI